MILTPTLSPVNNVLPTVSSLSGEVSQVAH